jgi:hypothetical protein
MKKFGGAFPPVGASPKITGFRDDASLTAASPGDALFDSIHRSLRD